MGIEKEGFYIPSGCNESMYKNKKIGVVVPAHNEDEFIASVIGTVPDFVDKVYVVNDASTDKTIDIVITRATQDKKLVVINRETNGGVGAAILSGHTRALQDDMDVLAVMAGDGQMDPAVLHNILDPVVDGKADYVKGNRLSIQEHRKEMPTWRTFGNFLLTWLTRIASGYWNISDPQDGYTAISAETLKKLDLDRIEKGFAFENDMLVKLNVVGARVTDFQHPAIYRGQHSKIRYYEFIAKTSWILLKDFFWRIWAKRLSSLLPTFEKKNPSYCKSRGGK
jgi:glycosyltransferase involved in cell wall biosynthesis